MLRNLKASPARLLLACSLSMLALAFAVEAKIAWFGPSTGPGSEVRAAKALPSEFPRVVISGDGLSNPSHLPVSLTFFLLIAVYSLIRSGSINGRKLPVSAVRIISAWRCSSLLLRAPPACF